MIALAGVVVVWIALTLLALWGVRVVLRIGGG